jgi:predicted CoA-binding protein
MTKLSTIQAFLEPKEMAVCGVSRNTKKFGRVVYDSLKEKGYKLYPVNPNTTEINGDTCYRDISELPAHVQYLYVVTPKEQTREVIEKAIGKGIQNIWIQQMSETPDAVELTKKNNINLIYKQCIFKFAEPVTSVHKFHRFMNKLFGTYPK